MRLLDNRLYIGDINKVAELPLPWEKLNNSSIMISGATGMIGRFLIDVIMQRNKKFKMNCKIYALGRNQEKAEKRFYAYKGCGCFKFVKCDISDELKFPDNYDIDYIFHAASNTHPVAYANDPVGTVIANVIGLNNLLKLAAAKKVKRFLFASSNEVYGENRGDTDAFDESYCGYIDCNTLRAGYPESKRAGEALCQAYIRQKNLDIVIPRLTRSFGPTMLMSDTKAISQFIKNGVAKNNIVLKSEGKQFYSYTYAADAVSGVLTCLLLGKCGEAYNIADEKCNINLKDLAGIIAEYAGTEVVFELPCETEKAGYSKATRAVLDSKKLQSIGWKAQFDLKTGLTHTIKILQGLGI